MASMSSACNETFMLRRYGLQRLLHLHEHFGGKSEITSYAPLYIALLFSIAVLFYTALPAHVAAQESNGASITL
jgi:hypothetical protein